MTKSFFVADIHLELDTKPETWRVFRSFLDFVQSERGDLYVLGDLFNYWATNKLFENKYRPLLEKLAELAKNNKVALLIGNRDFLLKKSYLVNWGIDFLGMNCERQINNKRVFMTHGDMFCDNGPYYLSYKKIAWPAFKALDIITPGVVAHKAAKRIRQKSRLKVENKASLGLSFDEALVKEYFLSGVDLVIYGHLHKALIKRYPSNKHLVILPDWSPEGGGYCLLSNGKVELLEYEG